MIDEEMPHDGGKVNHHHGIDGNDTGNVRDSEKRIRQMLMERNQINSRNRRGPRPIGGGTPGDRPGTGVSPRMTSANTVPLGGGEGSAINSDGSPGIQRGTPAADRPRRSLLSPVEITIEERPDLSKRLDSSTIKRGSRMMGGLLGHLKKARTDEEKSVKNPLVQKKIAAEQIVEKKIQNFSDNLKEARRLEILAKRNEDLIRKRELRIEIAVEERKLMRLKLEDHYTPMMNFLRTDTVPSLFYMPRKLNRVMDDLVEDTKAKIESKIESLRGEFDEEALREELRKKQVEWEAEHPLRELEIRDKAALMEARANRKANLASVDVINGDGTTTDGDANIDENTDQNQTDDITEGLGNSGIKQEKDMVQDTTTTKPTTTTTTTIEEGSTNSTSATTSTTSTTTTVQSSNKEETLNSVKTR